MNPVITNVGLVTRHEMFALASKMVLDGADIAADGILPRGTVLVRKGNGKWRKALAADTLAVNAVRILKDEIKVETAKDGFGAGYFEGFFDQATILDANPLLTAGQFTVAAGFYAVEVGELRLK